MRERGTYSEGLFLQPWELRTHHAVLLDHRGIGHKYAGKSDMSMRDGLVLSGGEGGREGGGAFLTCIPCFYITVCRFVHACIN